MSRHTIPPPLKARIVNEDKKITPIYVSYTQSIYDKLGSSRGNLAIVNDAVSNITNEENINLSTSGSLDLNGTIIDQTSALNSIFLAIGSNTLQLTNYLTSGLDYGTGTVLLGVYTAAPSAWIILDDGTIGSASSGATNRANADTADLFAILWNNVSNSYCPVSGGRGASAAADFAANKTITLPLTRGRAMAIAGDGAGLTSRPVGQVAGSETHTLTSSQIGSHTHTFSFGGGSYSPYKNSDWIGIYTGSSYYTHGNTAYSTNIDSAGSGGGHNNIQPTIFLHGIIKL